jgi:very-short-patch-repair endonuclease
VRPQKSATSVRLAKTFRRELTKPELLLWQMLKTSPNGHKFRKQHPAGPYVLDFFCARANLAIEIDGASHDTEVRAKRDFERGTWLSERRIDTLRIPAIDVLKDATEVTNNIVATIDDRLARFGKAPPSSLCDATSPSQVDGEE